MKVATKTYGLIDVDERQRITFPDGLYGFEGLKEYVLLDAQQQPFYWLQSLDSEQVAFILIDPFLFRPDYELDVSDEDLLVIGLEKPQDALVFAIITIPPTGAPMTANLQGPLVINRENHLGKQVVLTDPRWKTKHDILVELEMARKAPC